MTTQLSYPEPPSDRRRAVEWALLQRQRNWAYQTIVDTLNHYGVHSAARDGLWRVPAIRSAVRRLANDRLL